MPQLSRVYGRSGMDDSSDPRRVQPELLGDRDWPVVSEMITSASAKAHRASANCVG